MRVRARMYRQGLGDCFLLTFGEDGAAKHVLIDCGTLGATTTGVRMEQVAADIFATTGGHLDLLVATHEHKDHLSGFRSERDVFDQIAVDHVWLAWTENAEDELAQELEKHTGDLLRAAKLAARALLDEQAPEGPQREAARALGVGIRELLGFVDEQQLGSKLAKTVDEAMDYVTRKAPSTEYLSPGGAVLEPPWLPGVRVYVLGPPRDPIALAKLGDHGSPELYELAAARAADLAAGAAFFHSGQSLADYWSGLGVDGRQALSCVLPFDVRHRLEMSDPEVQRQHASYYDEAEAWRRVDYDWLTCGADFALQLDGKTNNTSLALAFEIIATGQVLLFPADAQVGNWLSWHRPEMTWTVDADGEPREITAADLLRRTVLYKVGHHASHNATVRELGLELMTNPELVALIPVDRQVAMRKTPAWRMPARGLYRRLIERTCGRVVRSDIGWAASADPDFAGMFSEDEWATWKESQQTAGVAIGDLFVDWVGAG